jgi:hypothetical protein
MGNYYSGRFQPKNIAKYEGDYKKIAYRSLWERQAMKWIDENPGIVSWSSEETIIPYMCATDRRMHRYFIDLKIKTTAGRTYLIEIKPKGQTIQPKKKRMSKKYLTEVMTWAKNQSKWEAATAYCKQRGWIFEIWTEDHLKALGIKILINEIRPRAKVAKKIAKKKV